MARYREYSYDQSLMVPISLAEQLQPGTFEYTVNYLVDHEIDLSVLEERYRNDETGAPVYDPAVLLKIILFAYSRGMTSSRRIAQACEENVCIRQSLTRAARIERRHPPALHHDCRFHQSDGARDCQCVHRRAECLLHRGKPIVPDWLLRADDTLYP